MSAFLIATTQKTLGEMSLNFISEYYFVLFTMEIIHYGNYSEFH